MLHLYVTLIKNQIIELDVDNGIVEIGGLLGGFDWIHFCYFNLWQHKSVFSGYMS